MNKPPKNYTFKKKKLWHGTILLIFIFFFFKCKRKLKYFLKYVKHNRDDSPLYIFDATFDEDKYASRLLSECMIIVIIRTMKEDYDLYSIV